VSTPISKEVWKAEKGAAQGAANVKEEIEKRAAEDHQVGSARAS